MRRVASKQRGMTLVEVTIVVAVIALSSAVAVASLNTATRADLRSSSSKLAGLIRRTYDDAALTGQTHRLVLDPSSKRIVAEATAEPMALDPDTNVLAQAAKAEDDLKPYLDVPPELRAMLQSQSDSEDDAASDNPMSALAALFSVGDLADTSMTTDGAQAFKAATDGIELADDVKLLDVWLQGMTEPNSQGVTYLYFFPSGFTQEAYIRLTDEDGCFTVKVAPLTGKTQLEGECLEPKK
jgi:general secretion pathway protein H